MRVKIIAAGSLFVGVAFLTGCGVASDGSKFQLDNGVSPNGYPAGQPKDPGSPALASSSETKYSRDQAEKEEPAKSSEPSNK
jgi:hypothetical protein